MTGRSLEAANASEGWLLATELLNRQPNRELVNLSVRIAAPATEEPAVRACLDAFITARRQAAKARGGLPRVEQVQSVANTIFPAAFYRPGPRGRDNLYQWADEVRGFDRRRHPRGDYFERLTSFPGPRGSVNQLEEVLHGLEGLRMAGVQNGKAIELGVHAPGRDNAVQFSGAIAVVAPGRRTVRGFPCLSHISVTLVDGRLSMSAIYRNHDFMGRAYGNYLGLGRLLSFLAAESGYKHGELLCVSTHAAVEVGLGGGFGRGAIEQLVRECQLARTAAA